MSKLDFSDFPKVDYIYSYNNNRIKRVNVLDQSILNNRILVLLVENAGIVSFNKTSTSIKAGIIYALNCKALFASIKSDKEVSLNIKLKYILDVELDIKEFQEKLERLEKEALDLKTFDESEYQDWLDEDIKKYRKCYEAKY